jgi:ABC-2 type transport system ATP-binding protein
MADVLRAIDLSKRFLGRVVVDHLNFAVPEGSVYALVGPHGSGKTATIKVLMNIHRPSSGRTEVLGCDSRRLSPRQLAEIGYVSENQDLPDWMTVQSFLSYLKPFYPAWDRDFAAELLSEFHVPTDIQLGRLPHAVRMKAALVSSLAYRPRLIVLDDPFACMDPNTRDDVIARALRIAPQATALISSRDIEHARTFATHVGLLERGRLRGIEEVKTRAVRAG